MASKPNNGSVTSFESILLNNKNASTNPQLADMLSLYTIAIQGGYIPSAAVLSALMVFSPPAPAAVAALSALTVQLHASGITDAAPVNTVVAPQTAAEDTNLSIGDVPLTVEG